MEDLKKKLMDMKSQIETAKTKVAQGQGALDQLQKRLISEFDCKDLTAAEKKLISLEDEEEKLEKEITVKVEKLEKEYSWV